MLLFNFPFIENLQGWRDKFDNLNRIPSSTKADIYGQASKIFEYQQYVQTQFIILDGAYFFLLVYSVHPRG